MIEEPWPDEPEAFPCEECGALVREAELTKHGAWHARLHQVAQMANSADAFTRPIG